MAATGFPGSHFFYFGRISLVKRRKNMFRNKINRYIYGILLLITLALLAGCGKPSDAIPPAEMVGSWIGLGNITLSNEYLEQRELGFMLIINAEGGLTGYAGDAAIVATKLQKQGWLQRLMGNKALTATFVLDGNLIGREKFQRDGGTIVFKKSGNNELLCTFTSTGIPDSRENQPLTVESIRLRPVEQ
jgi:hypothetical protein